ncbi:cation:proton antiporter, partial [Massilia cavernae]
LTTSLLVPVFFVYSGLNTKIGLVNTPYLWMLTLVVLLAATVGKGVACYGAARLNGESHREAMAVGTLMNARGLMELIILNIGLQRGIIEPALFAIMVMMAIITTLVTTPVFERIYSRQKAVPPSVPAPA